MSTPTLIISEPKPLRTAVIIACLLLLTIAAQWLYNQGHNKTLFTQVDELETKISELQSAHQSLQQALNKTTQEKRSLEQQLSEQQQTNIIQQGTEQQLQLQLNDLQTQVMTLKKELMFYQNITQGTSSSKLQVRETFITETELPDVYRYRIVITQGKKVSKPLTGKILLTLNSGQEDNNIDIAEHDLNLRHIQVIEGHITVTETVTPEAIDIKITQGKKTRLNETVQWQLTPQN
jgi:tetrahydromethanopterin S-methyltransferase subunit B